MTILKPGTHYWCTCGKSKTNPFCDGAHKGSSKKPVAFEVTEEKDYPICGCGKTKNPPYCDGSHDQN
jgi:CDGSH-type Zn-finger protein